MNIHLRLLSLCALSLTTLGTASGQQTYESDSIGYASLPATPDVPAAVQWFRNGFAGSKERHEAQGGFHYRFGGGVVQTSQLSYGVTRIDAHFCYSRRLPLNFEWGVGIGNHLSTNLGAYSNFFFTKRFTFDYGVGYEWIEPIAWSYNGQLMHLSQPYVKLGLTYMLNTKTWGGFSYYYMRGIRSGNMRLASHNFTYVMGQLPSLWLTLLVGWGIYTAW